MSIIDNSNNINKLTSSSLNTASVPSQQSSVSASPLPLVDTQKQELLKKLGITLEQYEALKAQVPDFDTLSLDKQAELITSLNTEKVETVQNTSEQEEVAQPKTEKQIYNEKTPDAKVEDCYLAFTKNTYIYGIKDKNGNIIAQSHSEEDWNKLSDAQKQAEIEKVKAFIDKDERLKNVKDTFLAATEKNSKLKEDAADSVMRGILASEFNGVSYIEFLQKDEYERLGIVDEYLTTEEGLNKDNLNASDKAYMKYYDTLKSQISKIVSERTGKDVGENLDASDVAKYMRYYNLDKTELMRNAILDKPAESRTAKEIEFIKNFQNLEQTRNKAKAQNLLSLQDELNSYETKLQNGQELSAEERAAYNSIKQYFSGDEAKNLKKFAAEILPQPKTDYEKLVASEVENFQSQIKDFVNGSDLETAAALSFLETKTKGMSQKEKGKYIDTFLKYYNTDASVNVYGFYAKQYKNLWDNNCHLDKQVNNLTSASLADQEKVENNIQSLENSNNPLRERYAAELTITGSNNLAKSCNPEVDDNKVSWNNHASQFKDADVQIASQKMNETIVNEELQEQAVKELQGSEHATDELQIYAADNADKLKGKAQLTSLDIATDKSEKALKRAAENGIFSRLEKENQQPAMALERQRLEERLDKDDAIKYTNMLADQIKDCHKDNQLAMHNEMMNSKYSEVQEHVAGNIKDYDPTVQAEALETVLASGNEKAIEAAAESVKYSPDCVKSEMAEVVEAYASDNAIQADSAILEQFADLIPSQSKTIQEKIASGQILSESELSTLSVSERRDYLASFFKKLPVDKKIKLLASMPDSQKKTIYTLIARTDSTLFNAIIKDKDRADQLLSMGLPEDVNNKIKGVVKFLAVSDIGYQNIAAKYDIEYDNNDAEIIKDRKYTTKPQDFDSKEIYKKDKMGNILA